MASTIILSDNGASSGSAGLKSTAGNDGVLILQTTTSGGTATNAVYVDNLQNIGVGSSSPTSPAGQTRFIQTGNAAANGYVATQTANSVTYEAYAGGSAVYVQSSTNHALVFGTNNTERGRWNAGAPILCLSGGSTSATGTGIAFPATQSASSDANTLDDYEEGTWVPVPSPNTGSFTTTSVAGNYVKIGRQVTVNGYISISDRGTATGLTGFSGLPFTSNSSSNAGASSASREQGSTGVVWTLSLPANSSIVTMRDYANSASISNGVAWVFTLTYEV